MSRWAKGYMRLKGLGISHAVEVRPHAEGGNVVELHLHRDDSKPGPVVRLMLDEARCLLRSLQAACDRVQHVARTEDKQQKTEAQWQRVLERIP